MHLASVYLMLGFTMDEEVIYSSDIAHITPTAIYFGNSTYQISNIASIEVDESRKWNPFAVILLLVGVILFIGGANNLSQWRNELILIGLGIILAGIAIQSLWPIREIRLIIRMAGSSAKTIVSNDKKITDDIKRSIEYAFSLTPRNSFLR